MHIPDGYLSPGTCAVFYGAMVPVWYVSSRTGGALEGRRLGLFAMSAAASFVIMMFNIPAPGGTSGHMVGSALAGIVLGPGAGVMSASLTLAMQAVLFGDGGLTTLGANCFNMAFIMSVAGYYGNRAFAALLPGRMKMMAPGAAAYIAVILASLAAAIELGIQPLLYTAGGRALYAPYPLSITVPAMVIPHLLFFAPVEALGTALVVSYLRRHGAALMDEKAGGLRPLWAVLIILALVTPLGLLAPGAPWGEWGTKEIEALIGYLPSGMAGNGFRGLLPGYGAHAGLYILSALAGSAVLVAAVYLWGRIWKS